MESRDAVLDEHTADRLLRGGLPIDDAPPRFREVAQVIALIGAPPVDAELTGEAATVARITAAVRAGRKSAAAGAPRSTSSSIRRTALVTAGAALATMSLFTGLAAADVLPDAAQTVASEVLAQLSINVPNPDHGHANTPGQPASPNGQGSTIPGLATDPNTSGLEHGKAVSGAASDGKSQAGEHGKADAAHGKADVDHGKASSGATVPTTTVAPTPTTTAPGPQPPGKGPNH